MNSVMTVSSFAHCSIEEIASSGAQLWLNIYMYEDRAQTMHFIRKAEQCGLKAIVVSCDIQCLGNKGLLHGDVQALKRLLANFVVFMIIFVGFMSFLTILHDFRPAVNYHNEVPSMDNKDVSSNWRKFFMGWSRELWVWCGSLNTMFFNGHQAPSFILASGAPGATWDEFEWIVGATELPVIAKGIITASAAEEAVKRGASAVFVSTHGGRQLDCVPASIDQLPEVVFAVRGRVPVLFDSGRLCFLFRQPCSGVRSGLHVFKALALGANMVLLGRSVIWALAYAGEEGVELMFRILKRELTTTMTLAGCPSIADITTEHVKLIRKTTKL